MSLVKLARDLTRPISPKGSFLEGKSPAISVFSRLVNYCNLARISALGYKVGPLQKKKTVISRVIIFKITQFIGVKTKAGNPICKAVDRGLELHL